MATRSSGERQQQIEGLVRDMQHRADALREQAAALHPVVAGAYRRRSAELELVAWALALRNGGDPATRRLHHVA